MFNSSSALCIRVNLRTRVELIDWSIDKVQPGFHFSVDLINERIEIDYYSRIMFHTNVKRKIWFRTPLYIFKVHRPPDIGEMLTKKVRDARNVQQLLNVVYFEDRYQHNNYNYCYIKKMKKKKRKKLIESSFQMLRARGWSAADIYMVHTDYFFKSTFSRHSL